MSSSIEIVGLYAVPDAAEPVHLLEVLVSSEVEEIDFGEFTQPRDGPASNWQVAYDERWLDTARDGRRRAIFFFHYLDPRRPLHTPFGLLALPPISQRPPHLADIEYEPPC
jgi:hypothetical protein